MGLNKVPRCKKVRADMLKKPSKSLHICYDSHDCKLCRIYISKKGWLAALECYKESMAGLFHRVCSSITENYE